MKITTTELTSAEYAVVICAVRERARWWAEQIERDPDDPKNPEYLEILDRTKAVLEKADQGKMAWIE